MQLCETPESLNSNLKYGGSSIHHGSMATIQKSGKIQEFSLIKDKISSQCKSASSSKVEHRSRMQGKLQTSRDSSDRSGEKHCSMVARYLSLRLLLYQVGSRVRSVMALNGSIDQSEWNRRQYVDSICHLDSSKKQGCLGS